jgi:hypothetical protein
VIIGYLEKELSKLPSLRGIVITSGGVMPPMTSVEKIKKVTDWVHNLKV